MVVLRFCNMDSGYAAFTVASIRKYKVFIL